jgi:hypothetical protein
VKTGNHHDPGLFYEEEQAVRETPHSSSPPSISYYRITQGAGGKRLHGTRYRFREMLR